MVSRAAYGVFAAVLLGLAGCQSSGGAPESADTPPSAAAPAVTGSKEGRCTSEAAKALSAPADDVALSAEYPLAAGGTAIDGSVNQGTIKQFRCEFDKAGGFVQVVQLAEGAN